MKKIYENIKNDILEIIERTGFYNDSDCSETLKEILGTYFKEEEYIEKDILEEYEEDSNNAQEFIKKFLDENYSKVIKVHDNGDAEVYYYEKTLNFNNVEEFKKYFNFVEE